jgi:mono/diheme cytochrome c family protein
MTPNFTRRIAPRELVLAILATFVLSMAHAAGPDDTLYAQGRYVYQRNCLTCHGARGDGKGDMAAGMIPKPRPFASGIFKYRSTPAGLLPTDADLARTVRNGISGTSMPAFVNLSDREIRVVTEYIKFFSPKWRRPENYGKPVTIPPLPDWLKNPATKKERAMRGRDRFLTSCAPCHGETADGKGPSASNLVDAWDQPAPPTDLRSPAIRSGPALTDLYRAIVTGIDGTPMPSFAEGFTDEQRWEIVAHLSTLREKFSGESTAPEGKE